jgi:hypothetical protein
LTACLFPRQMDGVSLGRRVAAAAAKDRSFSRSGTTIVRWPR